MPSFVSTNPCCLRPWAHALNKCSGPREDAGVAAAQYVEEATAPLAEVRVRKAARVCKLDRQEQWLVRVQRLPAPLGA